MSISKTTILKNVSITPAINDGDVEDNSYWPRLNVMYVDTFTDPDDSTLPLSRERSCILYKYTNNDLTDVSTQDQLVQDICAAIWS